MSEKKIVIVPSGAATRAMPARSSDDQRVRSSSELISIPPTPCSRTRAAVSTTARTARPGMRRAVSRSCAADSNCPIVRRERTSSTASTISAASSAPATPSSTAASTLTAASLPEPPTPTPLTGALSVDWCEISHQSREIAPVTRDEAASSGGVGDA